MKTGSIKFRWIACVATLLWLCVVGLGRAAMEAEQPAWRAARCARVAEEAAGDALITAPKSDDFVHLHETNRWGLSSTTYHLRVPIGRTLSTIHTAQRFVRMATASLPSHATTEGQRHALGYTIASIRFHIGYFIYHRCQMRC